MRYEMTILLVLMLAGAVSAAERADHTADQVAALIEQLGAIDFQTREKALAELGRVDGKWIDTLEAHAVKTNDEETKLRIEKAVQIIRVRQAPGKPVNGIKLVLLVDQPTIGPGQTIHLTSALMNTTDKPVEVRVGYTPTGNYFETGSALRRVVQIPPAHETDQPDVKLESPQWQMFVCGTGAQPIFTTIQPGDVLLYTCPMTYQVNPPAGPGGVPGGVPGAAPAARVGQQPGKPNALVLSSDGWCQFTTDGDETFTLKLVHKATKDSNQVIDWTGGQDKPQDTSDKWVGEIASNTVSIQVKPNERAAE